LTCEVCNGLGFEIVERDGREFARMCACRSVDAGADDLVIACRIPRRYEHCNLGTFEPGNPSLRQALEKAMKYCAGYPFSGDDEGLGLLFSGGNGVGKTHLAVAVLRELVTSRGVRGRFWDFHGLIREIKSSYNTVTRTTEEQVLEPVITTEVLLLDDLGAERITDWMVDTLFYIINERYLSKRVTIITTNFLDAGRDSVMAADDLSRREFLMERIGGRLRSRLLEMCLVVRVEGPDFREIRQSGKRNAVLGDSTEAAWRTRSGRDR
jgi:DNA replication protein DnaC